MNYSSRWDQWVDTPYIDLPATAFSVFLLRWQINRKAKMNSWSFIFYNIKGFLQNIQSLFLYWTVPFRQNRKLLLSNHFKNDCSYYSIWHNLGGKEILGKVVICQLEPFLEDAFKIPRWLDPRVPLLTIGYPGSFERVTALVFSNLQVK